ncbi:inorganic phosphate transporter [Desulfotruncus alcoholivorax]|uniref:inorganic phosphate transporter n=1 Tax=Desulfotruncus alcoholivorax TaxID=265477 RepID=UPI0003F7BD25|nr:inorganic phosphate transporter [Desulfotruncus alcoholivorax]
MDTNIILVAIVVLMAISFDFINGFHDTANAIATSVSTKALTPRMAILLASSMNLLGALAFTGVAKTIGGKIANPFELENGLMIVLAALLAAIAWNLITWYWGIPSSSSHALIGALTGSVIASAGTSGVNFKGFLTILQALVFSPFVAFAIGYLIMNILRFFFKNANPRSVNRGFRYMQIVTAAFQAFSHGTNDAQKSMGIITFALIAGGLHQTMDIPIWVKIICALAMAAGTSAGGWKIIKTVGSKIIKLQPISGFASDFTSASVIIGATMLGQPVSTTHVISSAIMGVGSAKSIFSVKWLTAQRMVTAWVITLPVTALLAAICYYIVSIF